MWNNPIFAESEGYSFPQVLSNSLISAYKSCPLKAFYSGIYKIRPKSGSVHLHAGKVYADALDTFRQYYYSGACDFEDARMMGAEVLIKSYGDYEPPSGKENKSWDRTLGAYLYYLKTYHPKSDILRPATINGRIASEFSFAEPLHPDLVHPDTGEPLLYSGRYDSIMEMGSPNVLFAYDDKTTSSLGPTWADQWELRSQFTGYAWGAQHYGIDLQGTIIRGISILKTKYGHAQGIVYHPQFHIDRWYRSTIHTVLRMIEDYKQGFWDSNLDQACSMYGGCDYRQLCTSPQPESWVDIYYETNRWNPLTGEDDPIEEAA